MPSHQAHKVDEGGWGSRKAAWDKLWEEYRRWQRPVALGAITGVGGPELRATGVAMQ